MAEPVYPSLEEGEHKPIGFEALEVEPAPEQQARQKIDDKRIKVSEEIGLLTEEERQLQVSRAIPARENLFSTPDTHKLVQFYS